MAISGDGANVYVATRPLQRGRRARARPSTGALAQATDGSGCIVNSPLTGCTTGVQLSGANAVAFSPGGDVYVTSLFSNSVTSFDRTSSGGLTQKNGTVGCLVCLRAVGCSFGRALVAPEGLASRPTAPTSTWPPSPPARSTSSTRQEVRRGHPDAGPRRLPRPRSVPGCTRARALRGVSSIALSPDGRNLYSTSFGSNAVDIFRRNK